jgi:hypothetical protein
VEVEAPESLYRRHPGADCPSSVFVFRASAVGECKAETRYDVDEGHDEEEMQVWASNDVNPLAKFALIIVYRDAYAEFLRQAPQANCVVIVVVLMSPEVMVKCRRCHRLFHGKLRL